MNDMEQKIANGISQALPGGPTVPPTASRRWLPSATWRVTASHLFEPRENWIVTVTATVTKKWSRKVYDVVVTTEHEGAIYEHSVRPLTDDLVQQLDPGSHED